MAGDAGDGNNNRSTGCCGFFKTSKSVGVTNIEVNVEPIQEIQELRFGRETAAFAADFTTPLTTGSYVTFKGTINANCLRFNIDLVCDVPNNIAFHFNPRLEQHYVVRNCKLAGAWGVEETTSLIKFPFETKKDFLMAILVANNAFMVTVNGKHLCAFSFRVPLSQIIGIEVHGNLAISDFDICDINAYPVKRLDEFYKIPIDQDYDPEDEICIELPFTGILPKGFQQGWQLEIYGKIKLLPHSFYVNLQDGTQLWPHPVIPLHLNPRFSSAIGSNSFVRNTWTNEDGWGREERAPVFPFCPGYRFCLLIRMERLAYSVWVDGNLTGEFFYKSDNIKNPVNCVYIQGDIHLMHISVRETVRNVDLYKNKLEIVKKI